MISEMTTNHKRTLGTTMLISGIAIISTAYLTNETYITILEESPYLSLPFAILLGLAIALPFVGIVLLLEKS